jgi:hypothetical protein
MGLAYAIVAGAAFATRERAVLTPRPAPGPAPTARSA